MRELRHCAWCGEEFIGDRHNAKFCCRDHLDKWFTREKQEARAVYRRMLAARAVLLPPEPEEREEVKRRA